MGTSRTAAARLEGGRGNPSLKTLQRYAAATGTKLRSASIPSRLRRDHRNLRTDWRCPEWFPVRHRLDFRTVYSPGIASALGKRQRWQLWSLGRRGVSDRQ